MKSRRNPGLESGETQYAGGTHSIRQLGRGGSPAQPSRREVIGWGKQTLLRSWRGGRSTFIDLRGEHDMSGL